MKKFAIICAAVVSASLITGCEPKNQINAHDVKSYMEDLYGIGFKVNGREFIDESKNYPDTIYNLTDENGIECHAFTTLEHMYIGSRINISEDYQVAYLQAHPELYEPLFDSDRSVTAEWGSNEYNKLTDVTFYVEFNDYDDIEKAVDFVYDKLSAIEPIYPDGRPDVDGPDIRNIAPIIEFSDSPHHNFPFLNFPLGYEKLTEKGVFLEDLQSSYKRKNEQQSSISTTEEEQ